MPSDADTRQRDWYYAINFRQTFETRHEAVGEAAIINRDRGDRHRDVTVWSYPECGCESPTATLDGPLNYCGQCDGVIA